MSFEPSLFVSPPLFTERLICRLPQKEDLNALHALVGEPSARAFTSVSQAPSRAVTQNWIRARLLGLGRQCALVLASKYEEATPIGLIVFENDGLWTHTHFLVADAHRNKGLMSESLSLVTDVNFKVGPFVSIVSAHNFSAARMLRKCGFAGRQIPKTISERPVSIPRQTDFIVFEKN